MVREVLKLKTDNGLGSKNPSFKDIEITEYSFDSPRMGVPTLTATLSWPTCLDDEWTHREYVELRGEKYYIRQVQTSEIANNNVIKYKHSLEFKSEREKLAHVYFYDVVPTPVNGQPSISSTADKPNTNSSKFVFYGTITEFADRLNCALKYAGIGDSILNTKTTLTDDDTPNGDGYCVIVSNSGNGDLNLTKEVSLDKQTIWDAITQGFNLYEIPFVFRGKEIIFNEADVMVSQIFQYGFSDPCLSVKKTNANAKIINRISFQGSTENIPYYYPNETEYGHIALSALTENQSLQTSDFVLDNPNRLVSTTRESTPIRLTLKREFDLFDGTTQYYEGTTAKSLTYGNWYNLDTVGVGNMPAYTTHFRIQITTDSKGDVVIGSITGQSWISNQSMPYSSLNDVADSDAVNIIANNRFQIKKVTNSAGQDFTNRAFKSDDMVFIKDLAAGTYYVDFWMGWHVAQPTMTTGYDLSAFWRINSIKIAGPSQNKYVWSDGVKDFYNLNQLGVSYSGELTDDLVGEGFYWTANDRMPFQENLMPPKYRNTLGKERFYNALNNTYPKDKDSNGNTVYYEFKNPYASGNPNEYIYEDDSIKPTIEGVKNSQNKLFGEIAGIAYDSDDNDSLKASAGDDDKTSDSAEYEHSFFYIKLNKFDGEDGFNLLKSASQTDAMTIQMTSGKCNGCKFEIQVVEEQEDGVEVWRNPVQTTGADGDIIEGTQSDIINKSNIQDWQQDTSKNSIWIAVKKDNTTFGVIMPNRSNNYMPSVGDTFNIINIDLPQGYILAAEKRGEEAMIKYMADNNEEKFTFDISMSRIFFAENPGVLAQLDENSVVRVLYNDKTYKLYVNSFSIQCGTEPLPDIKIGLTDTLAANSNFVSEVVAQAASTASTATSGSGSTINTIKSPDRRYVRKDASDRTPNRIASDKAFEVGEFVSGASGGILSVDPETGLSSLEVDYIKARLKAVFETLEIAHVRSIGGKLTVTPGGSISISFVEETTNSYRCYFKQKEDAEGADCRFIVGDDAYCQSFNISNGTHQNASNKFYWRSVTAVSNDSSYIELSKSDCAANSDIPEVGDVICQLGSNDTSRQSAIVLSTVDTSSPNITLFDGVTNFTLSGKEMVDMGVDPLNGKAYFHVYGNAYVGAKDQSNYMKYDSVLKMLELKCKLQIGSTVGNQSLEDYIKQVSPPVEQEDIEGFVNNIVGPQLENIQDQIDGVIETWFSQGVPTLSNYPASGWNTPELKANHLGDLYYDNETGTAYRFSQNTSGSYYWNQITDEAITQALAAAQAAQDTADQKRRVFVATPTADDVYDKGDLWVNATYGTQYSNDILRCVTSKAKGKAFNIGHWILSSKYTDDTLAQDAITRIAGYEYLKEALEKGSTTVDGGLILTSHIRLKDTSSAPLTWSGMNGIYQDGRTIASWYGGDMEDLFNDNDTRKDPKPSRAATSLIRMDGSAYFANGNIGFKKDGSGWLGNDVSGIKFNANGVMTFGSGVEINLGANSESLAETLESILGFQNGLESLLTPCDEDGNEISWSFAARFGASSLKAKIGLWSVSFISAHGQGGVSGGGSGDGLVKNVYGWNDLGNVFSDSTRTDTFNAYTIDRINSDLSSRIAALEGKNYLDELDLITVGSGNAVTAISLSTDKKTLTATKGATFLTSHQSLANYVTLNTVQSITGIKTFTQNVNMSQNLNMTSSEPSIQRSGENIIRIANAGLVVCPYATDGFIALRCGDKTNTNGNTELRIISSGYVGIGTPTPSYKLHVVGTAFATSFVKSGGTSAQFLKADGSVDNNTYLKSSSYTASDILTKLKTVDGSGSGLSADLLDGYHESSFLRYRVATSVAQENTLWSQIGIKQYNNALPDGEGLTGAYNYGAVISLPSTNVRFDIYCNHFSSEDNGLYYRSGWDTEKLPWKRIALVTDNVASATKLQTPRTIWGQSFDGSANVSGALSDVTNIDITGQLTAANGSIKLHGTNSSLIFNYQNTVDGNISIKPINRVTIELTGALSVTRGVYSAGYISARGQNTSSDIRLKNVLSSLKIPLHKISKAPSVYFTWKDNGFKDVGSVAQYWEKINPLLTPKDQDGNLTLQYGKAALLSVISVAQETSDLKKRVAKLEKENMELKRKLKLK